MINRTDLKLYFSMPDDEVMECDYIDLMNKYNNEGYSDDVEPDLRVAFTGYVDAPAGDAAEVFALKCHDILGTNK